MFLKRNAKTSIHYHFRSCYNVAGVIFNLALQFLLFVITKLSHNGEHRIKFQEKNKIPKKTSVYFFIFHAVFVFNYIITFTPLFKV